MILLEGDFGWACSRYVDLIGYWEKRTLNQARA